MSTDAIALAVMTDDELLGALRAAIDWHDDQARRMRSALAALTDGDVPAPAPVPAAVVERAKAAAPRVNGARPAGEHRCPDCGRMFSRVQGLGRHRAESHGVPGQRNARPAKRAQSHRTDPVAVSRATVPGRHFACGDCDFTATSVGHMIRHTIGEHHRQPSTSERTPVT